MGWNRGLVRQLRQPLFFKLMVMKRTSKNLVISASIVGVLAITCLYVVATSKQRDFGRFLRQLSTVQLGKTTPEQWKKDVNRASLPNAVIQCQGNSCGSGLRVDNQFVHQLRLAPLTIAGASVEFQDGVASEVFVILEVEAVDKVGQQYPNKGLVIRETSEKPNSCQQEYRAQVGKRYSPGDRSWGTITMDRCVSAADRAKALALNVGCLSKIGGCKTIDQMNPTVFAGKNQ
jgi:hypothetical protein